MARRFVSDQLKIIRVYLKKKAEAQQKSLPFTPVRKEEAPVSTMPTNRSTRSATPDGGRTALPSTSEPRRKQLPTFSSKAPEAEGFVIPGPDAPFIVGKVSGSVFEGNDLGPYNKTVTNGKFTPNKPPPFDPYYSEEDSPTPKTPRSRRKPRGETTRAKRMRMLDHGDDTEIPPYKKRMLEAKEEIRQRQERQSAASRVENIPPAITSDLDMGKSQAGQLQMSTQRAGMVPDQKLSTTNTNEMVENPQPVQVRKQQELDQKKDTKRSREQTDAGQNMTRKRAKIATKKYDATAWFALADQRHQQLLARLPGLNDRDRHRLKQEREEWKARMGF